MNQEVIDRTIVSVYDLIRKCFKSCPWRPFNARCTMPPKDEREKQEQIDYNRLRYTFAKIPCYLDAVRFNKTDYESKYCLFIITFIAKVQEYDLRLRQCIS